MLGKGGRSKLTRRVDKRNGRAVVRSVLVEMLRFEQQDQCSAGAARPIGKSRASNDSPGRILLGDIGLPLIWTAVGNRAWRVVKAQFLFRL